MARDKCKHEGSAGTKAADTTLTHHATALHTYDLMRDARDRPPDGPNLRRLHVEPPAPGRD